MADHKNLEKLYNCRYIRDIDHRSGPHVGPRGMGPHGGDQGHGAPWGAQGHGPQGPMGLKDPGLKDPGPNAGPHGIPCSC